MVQTLRLMATREISSPARNWYLSTAKELEDETETDSKEERRRRSKTPTMRQVAKETRSVGELLRVMTVSVDPDKAEEQLSRCQAKALRVRLMATGPKEETVEAEVKKKSKGLSHNCHNCLDCSAPLSC